MASTLFRKPALRWAVPGAVTALVVGAGIAVPVIASTEDELPARGPLEVLASLDGAAEVPFAGTVVQSADLGLPPLPGGFAGGTEGSGPGWTVADLVSGSNTARVWYSGPEQMRVALQDETEQSDMIVDGDDVWLWNSAENSALHTTRDTLEETKQHEGPPATPSAVADLALGVLGEQSEIEVDGTAQVAGRDAYELVVAPTDEQSLVGSVRLAVDGEHGVPLRVQVFAADAGADDDPAIEVGFTSVTFEEPDDSVFEFTPPSGATVSELDPDELDREHPDQNEIDRFAPTVVGEGWTSVVVLHGIDLDAITAEAGAEGAGAIDAYLGSLPRVEGSYGAGVVFESELASVLLLDDGRLLMGAVTPEALEEAAASPEAAAAAG